MNKRTFFLVAALTCACFTKLNAETEPFDRIVLKDMTVIKAGLVKEMPDSLAYFELNDTAFVKHVVARDQVFKWIKSTPPAPVLKKTAAPAPDSGKAKLAPVPEKIVPVQTVAKDTAADKIPVVDYKLEQKTVPIEKAAPPPVVVKDSVKDSIPVVDYQVMVLRNDSTKTGISSTKSSHEVVQSILLQKAAAVDSSKIEYDSSAEVPVGLTKVRLDPPTKNDGVKVVPRSGMLAINPSISIGSLGLGIRDWTASGFGFGAKGEWLWGSESGVLINGELMLALNKQGRVRWYLFGGGGYEWVSITTPAIMSIPSTTVNLSFANFVLGLGLEWRMGINRNHGLSIELGYQYGQGNYTIPKQTIYGQTIPASTNTYPISPVYFGFSYAYYF